MFSTALLGMAALFALYKLVYPFPDFMPDSYFYLMMGKHYGLVPQLWPVGYGWFLKTVALITTSHQFLVWLQYCMMQLSTLWALLTVFYLFDPPGWIKKVAMVFVTINPAFMYLANLVSSDAVFMALSICWVTLLLHLLVRPRWWQLILQAPLIVFLLIMRHQAMCYPLVMVFALALARYKVMLRLFSGLVAFLLIGWFIYCTRQANQRELGIKIFTGFSGWQLANNALYMYPYIQVDTSGWDSTTVEIDNHVRRFMDTMGYYQHNLKPWDGPEFMLSPDGPLKYHQFVTLKRWHPHKHGLWYYHQAGSDHGVYGSKLALAHPFPYLRYFVVANMATWMLPRVEQFGRYNEGNTYVWGVAKKWFGLETGVYCYWLYGSCYVIGAYRLLFCLLQVYLLIIVILFLKQHQWRKCDFLQRRALMLLIVIFLCNALFSIVAAPVVMRYQMYPLVLTALILIAMGGAMFRPQNGAVPVQKK